MTPAVNKRLDFMPLCFGRSSLTRQQCNQLCCEPQPLPIIGQKDFLNHTHARARARAHARMQIHTHLRNMKYNRQTRANLMTSIATVRQRFPVHTEVHLSFGITADSKTKQSKPKAVQVRAADAYPFSQTDKILYISVYIRNIRIICTWTS